jgi:hypothetical protein
MGTRFLAASRSRTVEKFRLPGGHCFREPGHWHDVDRNIHGARRRYYGRSRAHPPRKSRVIALFWETPLNLHGGFAINYWRPPGAISAAPLYLTLADDAGATPL